MAPLSDSTVDGSTIYSSGLAELAEEVDRLRTLEEAVITIGDTRYAPRVAARLLWHWEHTFRHDNHTQMADWLAGVREALEAINGTTIE